MARIEAIQLPSLPSDWNPEQTFKAAGKLSAAQHRQIEPVGQAFLGEARRKRHKRTFSEDERIQAQEKVKKTEEVDDEDISDNEDAAMLARDAKDWKAQDHYAVLGLSKYRYKATPDQIKRANRKKVLKHHPDKRAATGGTEDDSFFKCIQKATELLLDPVRRRQFDSVDEEADIEPPSKKETKNGDFYKLWRPFFESEARFSKKQPVPLLGDENSTEPEVQAFYDFWFNFDSWRSFEYLDEDVPDDSADRDQRRHIERKNLNQRKKKKTEDTARLRTQVDTALSLDPRIGKFKKEASAKKNARRNEREAEEKRRKEDEAKRKEEEEKLAKEKEEADKAMKAESKKAKEAAKNAVKKNKRVVRGAVKDANYFVEGSPSPARIDGVLNDVDALLAKLEPDELQTLTGALNGEKDGAKIRGAFKKEAERLVGAGKAKEGEMKTLVE
ncbi:MAG: hypothetical protein Q9162_007502 [Coniocarpon cinnabarinum]